MKNKLINKLCFVIITKNGPVSALEDRPSWNEIGTTFDDTAVVVEAKRKSKPVNLPKWSDGYEWLDKALPAAGTIIGGIIGGGMTSTAGNIVGGLGDLAAMVPGPVGAAGSAILKAGSGLANRAFGSKMNDANIAKVENNIKAMNAFTTNANNYDQLAANARNATQGMTFSNNFIGSDGWFSNKAKNRANSLRKQVAAGNNFVQNSLMNNANNIGKTQMQNLQANYAAYGGPIDGAIGYDFMQQSLLNDQQKINNQINRITSMPNSFINNEFALGGQRNGGYFSNGLTYIGEGGTHEQNPHEGVLMGYDEEGTPNLVEEGEYVWNDYVFSNRMKLPKDLNKIFKLGNKKDGYTFAEAVDFIQKESEERPNDPISARGLNQQLMKLAMVQEELRMQKAQQEQEVNKFDSGGPLVENGKESDYFTENVINEFDKSPGDWLATVLAILNKAKEEDFQGNFAQYKNLYNNTIKKRKALAPYLNGTKDINNITDEEAKKLRPLFTDGKYAKDSMHDLMHVPLTYEGGLEAARELISGNNINVPINIRSIDKNGKVTLTPLETGEEGSKSPLVYSGSARNFNNWLKTINSETGASPHDIITAMGYNADNLKLEKNNDNYYLNLANNKKVSLDDKTPSIYKIYNSDTKEWETIDDLTQIIENDKYKDYQQSKEIIDKDGNKVYYYEPSKDNWGQKSVLQALRYTPILGNLGQVVLDKTGVTNKPTYEQAEAVGAVADNLTEVAATPLGNYLTYKPTDSNQYLNQLYANTAAANRGIINQAGLNRGTATAGLLASNYNINNATGDLLTKLNQADFDRQKQVAEFNRGTDQYNSTAFLDAAKANQTRDQLRLQAITNEAKLKTEERLLTDTAKAANMSNLFESMSALGKEIAFEDMIKNNRAWTYGTYGQMKDINGNYINSLGGYLTIKKRR